MSDLGSGQQHQPLLTDREILHITDLAIEVAWTRRMSRQLQAYIDRMAAAGPESRHISRWLTDLASGLMTHGPLWIGCDSKPSFRLEIRARLHYLMHQVKQGNIILQPSLTHQQYSIVTSRQYIDSSTIFASPVPENVTTYQRKAIAVLVHLWKMGNLPSAAQLVLDAVRDEVPCGPLVRRFFEEVITNLRSDDSVTLRSLTEKTFEDYLVNGVERILSEVREKVEPSDRVRQPGVSRTSEVPEHKSVSERLKASIAKTLADYRIGELSQITPEWVGTWIEQFTVADQEIILREMDAVLQRFYFSRDRVKSLLRSFIVTSIIGSESPERALGRTLFLDLQPSGSSQAALLKVVDEILREDYGITISQCGESSPTVYAYIDDAIYTGNRLRYDLTSGDNAPAWIRRAAPLTCTLLIYTIARHLRGFRYAMPYVHSAADSKGITVEYRCAIDIDDGHGAETKAQCLWPRAWNGDQTVDAYVKSVRATYLELGWDNGMLFRPPNIPVSETLFSSETNRQIVERAFLQTGCQIRALHRAPKLEMRPLGYEKLASLGFGSMFATYHNVANNCPLALWWSLGGWHPLLPRRPNVRDDGKIEQSSDLYDPPL